MIIDNATHLPHFQLFFLLFHIDIFCDFYADYSRVCDVKSIRHRFQKKSSDTLWLLSKTSFNQMEWSYWTVFRLRKKVSLFDRIK